MSVIRDEEIKSKTKFHLHHGIKQKKFKNKQLPNVLFNINKQPNQASSASETSVNEEDILLMSVYDESKQSKLIGEYDLNIKPDQKYKEIEIDDADGNKILFKLSKSKSRQILKSV